MLYDLKKAKEVTPCLFGVPMCKRQLV